MALETSGYNTIGLPILADASLTGNMSVSADTQAAAGGAPQQVALTLNQMSAGAYGLVAAAGASQGNASALPTLAQRVRVTVTASTQGVILPAAATGKQRSVFVPGTVGVKVYPPVGGTLDTAATNTAVALAAGKGNIYEAISLTQWKTMVKGA